MKFLKSFQTKKAGVQPQKQWCFVAIQFWQYCFALEHMPTGQINKYILILRCCVDNLLRHYFPSSRLKGNDPKTSVDMLTFLNDSTCHPVRERSISCFCDAALTICESNIFHPRFKGYVPQISVDVLPIFIDSNFYLARNISMSWFCDAALAVWKMENDDFADCQRSIAKTGYTTFSDQVTITVI